MEGTDRKDKEAGYNRSTAAIYLKDKKANCIEKGGFYSFFFTIFLFPFHFQINSTIVPTKVLSDPMELESTLQSGLQQSSSTAAAHAAAAAAAAAAGDGSGSIGTGGETSGGGGGAGVNGGFGSFDPDAAAAVAASLGLTTGAAANGGVFTHAAAAYQVFC